MNKLNIKRAFKTLEKNGNGRMFYQQLDVPSKKVLVSNGHVVVTVSETDFEENKQYCKEWFENDKLKSVALDIVNVETEICRPTTASILCGDKQTRVMKSEHGLCVVNSEYIKALEDVGCSMYFAIAKPTTEQIKTPIVECAVADGIVYQCNAVLPICCNVRDVFEKILG